MPFRILFSRSTVLYLPLTDKHQLKPTNVRQATGSASDNQLFALGPSRFSTSAPVKAPAVSCAAVVHPRADSHPVARPQQNGITDASN